MGLVSEGPQFYRPNDISDLQAKSFAGNDFDSISSDFHKLLDNLHNDSEVLFILWITSIPMDQFDFHPLFFSALKRAYDWNDGIILLITPEPPSVGTDNLFFDELRLEIVDVSDVGNEQYIGEYVNSDVVWRGGLEFYDESKNQPLCFPGFEMVLKESDKSTVGERLRRDVKAARTMKILSVCSLQSVPQHMLLNQHEFYLRMKTLKTDDVAHRFLASPKYFGEDGALLARLDLTERCPVTRKTTEEWEKIFLTGAPTNSVEDPGRPISSIYLLIFNNPEREFVDFQKRDNVHFKKLVFLDLALMQNAVLRSFDTVFDTMCATEQVKAYIPNFSFNFDAVEMTRIMKRVEEKCIENLRALDAKTLPKDASQLLDLRRTIAFLCLERFKVEVTKDQVTVQPQELLDPTDLDTEALRFLEQARQYKQIIIETRAETSLQPSTDHVVLTAAELRKFFRSDGSALTKKGDPPMEELRPQRIKTIDQVNEEELKGASWEYVRHMNYHGIFFNTDEASDEVDKQIVHDQQKYLGSRETVTTSNSSTDCIERSKPPSARQGARRDLGKTRDLAKASTSGLRSLRRASLKSQPLVKTPEEIFSMKVRHAVFKALSEKGITEENQLFLPCFKRLFRICEMFGKDSGAVRGGSGTKEWLAKVAKQNVENVISLSAEQFLPTKSKTKK